MAYALTPAATTVPALTGLASFAAVIAEAAHLPLVPVIDWATRAAKSINNATPVGATTVSIIDSRSRRVVHAGCACGPALPSFETTLYRLTTNGRRQQPSIGRARFAEWADTDSHPFLEAGLPHGTVICATVQLASDTVLSICHWRSPAPRRDQDLDEMNAVFDFIAQIARRLFPSDQSGIDWLSQKETDVLNQIALGSTVREIADLVGRSPHTIHDHVKAIHRKTGLSTRGALVAAASGQHVPTIRNPHPYTTLEAPPVTPAQINAIVEPAPLVSAPSAPRFTASSEAQST